MQHKVVSITKYKNHDLIKTCESILEKAQSGEITGILYAVRLNENDHGVGVTGDYLVSRTKRVAAMGLIIDALHSETDFVLNSNSL